MVSACRGQASEHHLIQLGSMQDVKYVPEARSACWNNHEARCTYRTEREMHRPAYRGKSQGTPNLCCKPSCKLCKEPTRIEMSDGPQTFYKGIVEELQKVLLKVTGLYVRCFDSGSDVGRQGADRHHQRHNARRSLLRAPLPHRQAARLLHQ